MARYTGPKQKLQRRIGEDLSLKTNAVKTAKRLLIRPGQHGHRTHRKLSDYGVQLKEKQKVKFIYGVLEKYLKKLYETASKDPTSKGTALLSLLERRLDNVVYRLGWAPTRAAARQLVSHNHLRVNNKKMNIPSYRVKVNDVILLKEKATKIPVVAELLKDDSVSPPAWLERQGPAGKVVKLPLREEISENIDEQLVIEYYSR
ncbi:MAG: 30S ribosomal protein S4 [Candidatus Pacebacteria bacterium]|nr:30S ribosomal protein S4 [Candidatus Paceibacterota bacterium]